MGAYPGGFPWSAGEQSQVAAGGRPLAVAAEVGREMLKSFGRLEILLK